MIRLARRLFAVISVFCCAAISLPAHANDDFSLTILHTNDVHSIFRLIDVDLNFCAQVNALGDSCFIPAARLSAAISAARERNTNTILLDAGDQFPTPLYPVPPEIGRPLAAELMNRFGYDGMTLGNHEFDDGPEVLAEFVDALAFPVLTADENVLSDPLFENRLDPTTILEISGEKVGLVGLGAAGMDFDAPAPHVLAQKYADRLTAQDINRIIVISHFGFDTDKRIAEMTSGIDVIVGGHSHTRLSNSPIARQLGTTYPTMVHGVAIVHAYAFGVFLGELHVTFDELGNVLSAQGEPIPMDSVEDDVEVRSIVEEAAASISAIGK